MRLLFLSNFFPPDEIGGLEQICEELTRRLRQRAHSVEVLTRQQPTGRAIPPGDGVRRVLHLQADLEHYRPIDFFLKRSLLERDNLREMRKAIREVRPEAVLVWGMWNLSREIARVAEDELPGRVAYLVASYWPSEDDMHLRYWREPARRPTTELIKRPLRAVAVRKLRSEGVPVRLKLEHVRCVSKYVRDTLVEKGALPPTTGVQYLGVDPDAFDAPRRAGSPEKLRLLYCGSLLEHKGVHTVIEALARLPFHATGVDLTIVGDGRADYRRRLDRLVAEHGLAGRVRFVGRVPRAEVGSWLRDADVFVFPSIWAEPMARSVMEAMAAGLPVVGTTVGGQVEMLREGETALTFPAGSADRLAQQIRKLRDNPELASRLGRAGCELVRHAFDIARVTEEVESWLKSISESRQAS